MAELLEGRVGGINKSALSDAAAKKPAKPKKVGQPVI